MVCPLVAAADGAADVSALVAAPGVDLATDVAPGSWLVIAGEDPATVVAPAGDEKPEVAAPVVAIDDGAAALLATDVMGMPAEDVLMPAADDDATGAAEVEP